MRFVRAQTLGDGIWREPSVSIFRSTAPTVHSSNHPIQPRASLVQFWGSVGGTTNSIEQWIINWPPLLGSWTLGCSFGLLVLVALTWKCTQSHPRWILWNSNLVLGCAWCQRPNRTAENSSFFLVWHSSCCEMVRSVVPVFMHIKSQKLQLTLPPRSYFSLPPVRWRPVCSSIAIALLAARMSHHDLFIWLNQERLAWRWLHLPHKNNNKSSIKLCQERKVEVNHDCV